MDTPEAADLHANREEAGSALKHLEHTFCYQKWDMPPHLLKACVSCTNQSYRKSDAYNLECRGNFDATYARDNQLTVCTLALENDPARKFYIHSLVLNSQSEFFQSMSSFLSASNNQAQETAVHIPTDITCNKRCALHVCLICFCNKIH
jgi:hypothetical protein